MLGKNLGVGDDITLAVLIELGTLIVCSFGYWRATRLQRAHRHAFGQEVLKLLRLASDEDQRLEALVEVRVRACAVERFIEGAVVFCRKEMIRVTGVISHLGDARPHDEQLVAIQHDSG